MEPGEERGPGPGPLDFAPSPTAFQRHRTHFCVDTARAPNPASITVLAPAAPTIKVIRECPALRSSWAGLRCESGALTRLWFHL